MALRITRASGGGGRARKRSTGSVLGRAAAKSRAQPAPNVRVPPKPKPAYNPLPVTRYSAGKRSTGYSAPRSYSAPRGYSAPSGGGAPAPAPAPVEPPKPVVPGKKEWAAGDSTYQALLSSLQKQLSNYNTDYRTQLGDYDTNLRSSFDDLGYGDYGDNFRGGNWNQDDLNTASGRGYNNLSNDFAARGLLQGSEYAGSRNDFQRSLDDQLGQLTQGRNQFRTSMGNQRSSYLDQYSESKRNAYNESISRRAAKYGLT